VDLDLNHPVKEIIWTTQASINYDCNYSNNIPYIDKFVSIHRSVKYITYQCFCDVLF
jgi:hypothetical protein